ncbi:MAG: adenylate kinase [Chloroflexi bacterium]|nr:adenylate kinase [Chloroflexota bacterium]
MYVIFLGAPGAGKGTQAGIVAQKLGLAHVATGDLFRQAVAKGTELGLKVQSYLKEGKLVPDDVTVKMLLERIAAPDCRAGVILDGFPRTLEQARALDKALADLGKTIDRVIYVNVAEDELLRRLSSRWICRACQAPYNAVNSPPAVKGKCDRCGGELYQRPDDTPETVKKRLQVYFAETAPLIDYYKRQGKLAEVAGEGDMAGIGQRIIAALKEAVHR